MEDIDAIDRAIRRLGVNNMVRHGEETIRLVCLVRQSDQLPLKVPWWRGKEVCLIGVDQHGNFLLRHCDGSVRYWKHASQADTVIARSVKEFVARIE